MQKYSLRYAGGRQGGEVLDFEARSVDAALTVARQIARSDWADLYQDEDFLCRLQLADASGVWRIAPID